MTTPIALSVLIPNYNYGRYIGETIQSVLVQASPRTEIVITDNASTDNSIEVVKSFRDDRVKLSVNPCNVGFAANLERVASLARGTRMLLLSSDDRMLPGALEAYERFAAALGDRADRCVWGAETTIINSKGETTGHVPPDPKLWRGAAPEPDLSRQLGMPVRSLPAQELLRRSLLLLRTPLPFASTCYPRALHDEVGGYSGGRLINPDKWFLWKVLSVAETAYVIDRPLFEYRVHDAGQGAQEQRSGALKHLTDQYTATFNLPDSVLAKAGLDRDALANAFVEQDIALRGLVALSDGKRVTARRSIHFALATYPDHTRRNPKVWALRALLRLGPVGERVAKLARARAEQAWQRRQREGDS
jgi:glycosyltransferase involved in cell wall biosynthesis